MKKGQVYAYHREITAWNQSGSVLAYFNRSRIADFYKEYGIRVNKILDEISKVQKEFYEFENDKMKLDKEGKPILLKDKLEQDANDRFDELMNQEVAVSLESKLIVAK